MVLPTMRAPDCVNRYPGTSFACPRMQLVLKESCPMFAALHDHRERVSTRCASTLIAVAAFAMAHGSPAAELPSTPADGNAAKVAQAVALEHGEGVAQDQRKAALLYCEAARGGDPEAMYALGWMYANGRGVARSDALAAYPFAQAAAAGHSYARRMQRYV